MWETTVSGNTSCAKWLDVTLFLILVILKIFDSELFVKELILYLRTIRKYYLEYAKQNKTNKMNEFAFFNLIRHNSFIFY